MEKSFQLCEVEGRSLMAIGGYCKFLLRQRNGGFNWCGGEYFWASLPGRGLLQYVTPR
jgi:hypothetical protein